MKKVLIIGNVVLPLLAGKAHGFLLGDADNGEQIHQAQCAACHANNFDGDESRIYTRDDRRVKTVEGMMGQVEFCNNQLKTNLADDEINDIVKYLNDKYYKFE